MDKEIAENKIIDLINIGSGGRLTVFKPEVNNGVDLAVKKRAEYDDKEILLLINLCEKDDKGNLVKNIENFTASPFLFHIFLYFDAIKQEIDGPIFIISSLELENVTKFEEIKFSKFKMQKEDLGARIFDLLSPFKK